MTTFKYMNNLSVPKYYTVIHYNAVYLYQDENKLLVTRNGGQNWMFVSEKPIWHQSISENIINMNGQSNLINLFEVYCLNMSTTISTTFILKTEIIFNFLPDKTYQKPPIYQVKLVFMYSFYIQNKFVTFCT